MDRIETREMVSAMADGELQGEAFARGMAAVGSDPAALQAWHAYHLIGDVLRSGELARGSDPELFLGKLRAQIAQEQPAAPARVALVVAQPREAANDAAFRWKLVAGLASVAAVGAVAWTVWGVQPVAAPGAQVATVPPGAVLTSSERGPMLRDPRLDELLAAHRQLGGASALQQPAGFLRNATFDGSGR